MKLTNVASGSAAIEVRSCHVHSGAIALTATRPDLTLRYPISVKSRKVETIDTSSYETFKHAYCIYIKPAIVKLQSSHRLLKISTIGMTISLHNTACDFVGSI